jgi:hypothetical protein
MRDQPEPDVVIDDDDGRRLAEAEIDVADGLTARASMRVEAGHIPPGTGTRLVDAVFDSPEVAARQHVKVSLPLGGTEILERIRERCDETETRAAGASCLVDADIREQQPETD